MTLTRRQALLAITGAVAAVATTEHVRSRSAGGGGEDPATAERVDAATAVAEVVYPSGADVGESFVERRVFGRAEPAEGHFENVAAAIDDVESFARSRYGAPLSSLRPSDRRRVLDEMGVYAVHADPDGTTAERVRYYLVNDLLYVLFTHPKGGELLGIPNPPGHFGGREIYQRGPTDDGE